MRYLYLIVILVSTLAHAQVMQWSTPVRLKGAAVYTKVLGENEHGVYLLRYKNKVLTSQILIDKYSHHLQVERTEALDLQKARLVKIKMLQDQIIVFKAQFNRKTQANELFGYSLDYDLQITKEPVLLASIPIQEFGDRGDFRVRISENEQRIAVIYTLKENSSEIRMFWKHFNSNFEALSTQSGLMPITRKNFTLMNFMLSDSSNTYALIRERRENEKGKAYFIARLIFQEQDSISHKSFDDSLKYRNFGMTYDRANQEVVVVCFYGQHESYGSEGAMTYRFHIENKSERVIHAEFGEELISELNLSRSSSSTAPEGFEFLKIIPRSDGGVLFIAEQKEIDTENDIVMLHGIPTSTSKNIYNYNDILAVNIDSIGDIEWSHVIHKNQTTINDGGYFSSAVVYVNPNFIQIIYNDQVRSSGEVMQYTLYSNGKIKSSKLLKSEIDYVVVVPIEAHQVSSNKLIIPTSKNRRFALLKLIYD